MLPTSYGYELELGDVDRKIIIPSLLGSWEYSETDIYNKTIKKLLTLWE
jgi:hypothetical protein